MRIVTTAISILFIITAGCKMPENPVPLSADVPDADGWEMETVVSGLEHPWSVVWTSDNEMLVSERGGQIKIIREGVIQPEPVDGLPDIYAEGQGGLLDLSLHPDFENNRLLYFSYSAGDKNSNRTTVSRGIFDGLSLTNIETIFEVNRDKSGNQHFGSRMLWITDNSLLITLADGGNYIRFQDGGWIREQAQNNENHLGTIVHITEDGLPSPEGPYVDDQFAMPEIWSYGHRNVQGIAMDPETGNIWANEHGSRGGDELNLLEAGGNYGWPDVTYSREYHYTRISGETSKPGMIDPKVVWTPAQAPSGLTFYTGDDFPEWQGDLFSGGLVGEQVRRIILDEERTGVIGEEKLTIDSRVRDVRMGPDGFLYLLTDEENGELIRIIPAE